MGRILVEKDIEAAIKGGAIGLANSAEPMIQSPVGGNRANNGYFELVVRGATGTIRLIKKEAHQSSGLADGYFDEY